MSFLPAILLSCMLAPGLDQADGPAKPPEQSPYYVFVDREFIFTVEMVKPGVPLFNFISMIEEERNLLAKQIQIILQTRKVPGKFFLVDTGDPKEPVIVPSVRMRPRSSFGVRLQGEFGTERELLGATVRIGEEDFKLVPLASFDFEKLAMKINRLSLASPDFREDWRVLKLELLGTRQPARR